jgi:4-amino-4-deoxy-L-arabinose transferase-like glycosyltransferase
MTISSNKPERVSEVTQPSREEGLPRLAVRPVLAIAVVVTVVLIATSARYGYHGDELYFLAAGRHLAWGYPDQPPFVPLLARLLSEVAPGSLPVLRLPSALAGGALIVLTALATRELRGGRAAQVLACAVTAVAPFIGTTHRLTTATFNLLVSVLLCWLFARILRTGDQRLWPAVGLAAGAGLLASGLVVFLVFAVVTGIVVAGPRRPLRSGWFYAGGAIALVMWAPYLVWQASHDWPQFEVARSIAAGESGSSNPWWAIVPKQLDEVPIWFAPIWIVGLVQLLRKPALRPYRALGVAVPVLAVVFMATGGKSYYLAVMLPVLLAAGAQPTVNWLRRGRSKLRRGLFAAGLVLSAATLANSLPLLPLPTLRETAFAGTYDTGATIGWPAFVEEIARVYHSLPPAQQASAVVLTSNYSEAGAVERYGPAHGLPAAYSPHNGFWYWGPPPDSKTVAIIVGADRAHAQVCGSLTLGASLDNHVGIPNEEQGKPVWICTHMTESWSALWSHTRYFVG